MKKFIIVGGGLAGISASVYLKDFDYDVEIIEASPKLGGRTYSFFDEKLNAEIDNGQHLLMGAYQETIKLLKILHTEKLPHYQPKINIKFVAEGNRTFYLKAPHKFYPLNLLQAIWGYQILSSKEKILVITFLLKNYLGVFKNLENLSIETWLKKNKQTENSIKNLWEIIAVGAMNTDIKMASALLFSNILNKMFFKGNKSASFILTNKPLNHLFIDPAEKYFSQKNISVKFSEKLKKIEIVDNKVSKIFTNKREISNFDNLVLAIPFYSIQKIKSNRSILEPDILKMEASPIITIHLWFSENLFEEKFVGLLNSKFHWIFKNEDYFSIVVSAADDFIKLSQNEILKIICNELKNHFSNFKNEHIIKYKIIKEKRATLLTTTKNEELRKKIKTDISNLTIIGDWINTNLPCTIEGAILSGTQVYAKK